MFSRLNEKTKIKKILKSQEILKKVKKFYFIFFICFSFNLENIARIFSFFFGFFDKNTQCFTVTFEKMLFFMK